MSAPFVSVILPVFRGEAFIVDSVTAVIDAMEDLRRPFEVIAVFDGAVDHGAERLRALDDPRISVVEYEVNQGKGFAICAGIAQARGRLVGWLDADLDIHPEVMVAAAARLMEEDLDAVVGSKRHPGSVVDYPRSRRVLSHGFQLLVRLALRVDVRDTQVGAKLFRREMLETVVPLLLIKRYAFDLEVLAVGAQFGFDRVEEVPVRLDYRFSGTGINADAVQRMFVDTLAITYRIRVRHWYVRQFSALHRRRLDVPLGGDVADLPSVPASNLDLFRALLPTEIGAQGPQSSSESASGTTVAQS